MKIVQLLIQPCKPDPAGILIDLGGVLAARAAANREGDKVWLRFRGPLPSVELGTYLRICWVNPPLWLDRVFPVSEGQARLWLLAAVICPMGRPFGCAGSWQIVPVCTYAEAVP